MTRFFTYAFPLILLLAATSGFDGGRRHLASTDADHDVSADGVADPDVSGDVETPKFSPHPSAETSRGPAVLTPGGPEEKEALEIQQRMLKELADRGLIPKQTPLGEGELCPEGDLSCGNQGSLQRGRGL